MSDEIWRPVVGYEELYEISNKGTLRNLKGRTLKLTATGGYMKASISNGNKVKTFLLHRLVAMAFLANPENHPVVHHKDHNKLNNHVENLEWVTHRTNILEAIKAGRHNAGQPFKINNPSKRFTDEQVKWMRQLKDDGYSLTELAEIFNVTKGYISEVVNGLKRFALSLN